MKEIKAVIQPFMLDEVLGALEGVSGLPEVTLFQANGWDPRHPAGPEETNGYGFAQKTILKIVVPDEAVDRVVDTILESATTGRGGDGKVFVSDVLEAAKIRTGQRGEAAL
jgi:nitrogen regulatory protein P-II 1